MTDTVLTTRQPTPTTPQAAYAGALTSAFADLFNLAETDTTELMLVRHAEPKDRSLPYRDPLDLPLSEHGRIQAHRLAQRLRRLEIDGIYTSPVRPALETAMIIGVAKGLTPVPIPELREVAANVGVINENGSDRQKLQAEFKVRFLNNPRWDALRWLEPSRSFRHRVIQAIDAIITNHTGERVVIVTHAGPINAYLSMVLDIKRDMFFLPAQASISAVRVLRDLYAVQSLNDVTHLLPKDIY